MSILRSEAYSYPRITGSDPSFHLPACWVATVIIMGSHVRNSMARQTDATVEMYLNAGFGEDPAANAVDEHGLLFSHYGFGADNLSRLIQNVSNDNQHWLPLPTDSKLDPPTETNHSLADGGDDHWKDMMNSTPITKGIRGLAFNAERVTDDRVRNRLLRNRASAERSRQRRKGELKSIEERTTQLEGACEGLREENGALRRQLDVLQVHKFQASVPF